MNELRKAAEMALWALEDIFGKEKKDVGAIQALRQALAQSEQEPVAYKEECWACGCEECICATKVPGYYESKIKEAVLAEPVAKVWLWRNFVNDKPEYWAFDNPYPINLDNDDPQTIGSPCGYALLKPSRNGSRGRKEDEVLREIKGALAREQTRSQSLAQPEQGNSSPNYPITESNTPFVDSVTISAERVDETAKREHEPVAWLDSDGFPWSKEGVECRTTKDTYIPLYTAPKKEWVGLTDEDRQLVLQGLPDFACYEEIMVATEAKLKEKNGG